MNEHFLQSDAWQAFQESLGRTTFRRSGDGWSYLAILERGTGNSRLYCPFGPIASDEKHFHEALASLQELGTKLKVTFLRIGPIPPSLATSLSSRRWKSASYIHLQPEHTRHITLDRPEEAIVTQMAQPVRNCYRNYKKKGVTVHTSNNPQDIALLTELIHHVAARTGLSPHSDAYFKKQAETLLPLHAGSLWYATLNSEVIATALFFDTKDTRIYAHAAANSTPDYRKLNAGTAILSEAIVDAKRRGMHCVDLYGVAPETADASHPWFGFTKFKRSFGGEDVYSGQSWELPLQPIRYQLYRLYQYIYQHIRK